MFLICLNMLLVCMKIYIIVYAVISRRICLKRDILYTCQTRIQKKNSNDQPSKRCTNQANQRTTKPYSATTIRFASHARLPNNHQNTQKLRSLLWTKHYLSTLSLTGEKRSGGKQVEHEK